MAASLPGKNSGHSHQQQLKSWPEGPRGFPRPILKRNLKKLSFRVILIDLKINAPSRRSRSHPLEIIVYA